MFNSYKAAAAHSLHMAANARFMAKFCGKDSADWIKLAKQHIMAARIEAAKGKRLP